MNTSIEFEPMLFEDGSGRGAALVAAVAAKVKNATAAAADALAVDTAPA